MSKDTAYQPYITAKNLLSGGFIKTLKELIAVIPPTHLAKDMRTGPDRLNSLLDNPELFMFQDAYKIADILGVERKVILDLIHAQCEANQKGRRKK